MDIKTCRYCKKSFRGFTALCPACAETIDKKYQAIRNYLDTNHAANIRIVAEATGVEEKVILFLIREGRIELRGASADVACLKCGAAITSGKYCDKCKGNLVHDLDAARSAMRGSGMPVQRKAEPQTNSKGRIHILKDN